MGSLDLGHSACLRTPSCSLSQLQLLLLSFPCNLQHFCPTTHSSALHPPLLCVTWFSYHLLSLLGGGSFFFVGCASNWEKREELPLQPGHCCAPAHRRSPFPCTECYCLCLDGQDFPCDFQVNQMWLGPCCCLANALREQKERNRGAGG